MEWPDSVSAWGAIEQHQDMYRILKPLPDARRLVATCKVFADAYNVKLAILTAIPRIGRLPLASQHKQEWLAEHFPDYPELLTNFNIGPYAMDKQNHCTPNDVLIDDSNLNIPQWIAKGGKGILHTNYHDSVRELAAHISNLTWTEVK